ncbi:MAG: TetR family transcriptional regulator [Leucobacter sp.]
MVEERRGSGRGEGRDGGRGGRRPAQLSRAVIVDAAAAVVERDGADALTLRRLGAELGTNHTAVLRHFAGKDGIERRSKRGTPASAD